ncbi:Ribosomal protein L4/L1e, partial [mine drainage metagenome]
HHRAPVFALDGSSTEHVQLPLAFSEPIRPDLIRRAVLAARANRRQAYGTSPTAGLRHSVQWSGKGKGVSRTPRLMDSMRGAQAPNTVGGRPAHPPRPERIWTLKINTKERRKAFASALAATREERLARARGHAIPDGLALPVILEPGIETIRETQEALSLLDRLQLASDVERARDHSHLRAGRGKRRGRVRRTPRSLLVVTTGPGQASGFRNLPGVDVVGRPPPHDRGPRPRRRPGTGDDLLPRGTHLSGRATGGTPPMSDLRHRILLHAYVPKSRWMRWSGRTSSNSRSIAARPEPR